MNRLLSISKLLAVILVFAACKKNTGEPVATTPTETATGSPASANAIKDSTLLLTKDIYLWNTQIPATFNALSFSDPVKIMEAIRPYSLETGFTDPVDRFSFAIEKKDWDAMSTGMSSVSASSAADGDIGLSALFLSEGDLRVRLVEPESPAGRAGIRRGWRITKVNDNNNITTANATFLVDNIYNAASVSLTFLKPDGSSEKINLSRAHYSEKPVYMDTVFSIGNRNIGYLLLNSFLGNQDEISAAFERVFSKFQAAQVSDLIVDLRYNGGGYVSVQQKLANYLVSVGANGNVMMKQTYNAKNSNQNLTTLFRKQGSVNLDRLYFIVSKATASASELLINNLKPYMNVQLVGNTTYGKPVGFYPIPVGDWYIFPVSFRTTNRNGEGNYFNGLNVNSRVADGLDKDWGDMTESCLANVIRNITSGSYRSAGPETPFEESLPVTNGNNTLEKPFLKLTIGK